MIKERKYYLYGTTDKNCWSAPATGFDVYTSTDLENWQGPFPAFRPGAGFWADRNFWAPEVYYYGGKFYMFASFKSEHNCRGTQVLVSESPLGPFVPFSDGPVTPKDWECLDGTLYMDREENPWMVFCHEWLQVGDGEIWAIPMTKDLRRASGEPVFLFRASEAPWVRAVGNPKGGKFVTDGPFLYRTSGGDLLMIWSSFTKEGYALGVARSLSGEIEGPWKHDEVPLFNKDGGHGMLFKTFDGEFILSIHMPNKTPLERPIFLRIREEDSKLILL
ncbi:MAG TPA: family 43 glycosylhydrolase [Clostridiaceae bacterium]|nr:family 43 glycosylhydrolase [Clostridiaceae bacterium]